MEANETKNVYNLIIIDESGSMGSIYEQALSGINDTIKGVRRMQEKYPKQRHYVSIVTFEDSGGECVKTRRDRVPVEKVADMTVEDYCPAGCTPLYDAMGSAISHLDAHISEDDAVMVTVITDGYENSSKEYSASMVRNLVSRQREKGWSFAYIGANQDSVEVARELHIPNAMNFEATPEGTLRMSMRFRKAREKYADAVNSCMEMEMTIDVEKKVLGSFSRLFEDLGENEDEA